MTCNLNKNLYFSTTNCVFTRAQALIWVANGLSVLDVFEKSSGKILSEIIIESPSEKTILLNFKGVVRLDDHSLDDVYLALGENVKQLIVYNGDHLFGEFNKLKKDKPINISQDSVNKIIIIGNNKNVDFSSLVEEKEAVVNKYINRTLENTFTKFEDYQRLSSTPFLANGEFDSKKIIESPKDFMWISLYLSDKLHEFIEHEKLNNVKLISGSLRGAVFTSILGILNDVEYITVDHIGPIHKVYDNSIINIDSVNCNFIYIGDFVFGGTEIKITKVYVSLNGANLNHALVLGSLFESQAFSDFKLLELNSLIDINKEAQFKLFN